jgi:S-adenosylmethionine decarboxylase
MHLIIDGYGSNVEILKSEEFIYRLLDQYPAEIGMTKISSPVVVRYTGDDWGISGFVMIAESHISIHTFVERCYVNIDVFSCKDFDDEQAIKDLSERLQLTEKDTQLIDRDGQRFSRPGEKDRIVSTRL